jgi:N-dimethylarginine dimethylaminohydrolase
MATFGVPNAYGNLRKVIMHLPGNELRMVTSETLEEFHFDRPVDQQKFITQYKAMLDLFALHEVEVLLLHEILKDDHDSISYMSYRPNMTYTRDLAAVFKSGAVLMGPYLKGRRGDQEMLGRAFRKLGVPILGAIEPPGFLEGGGVTIIGDDTVVASLCDRANEEGTRALRNLVLDKDFKYFLEVPLPFGHIHIDGIFMMLDKDLCLLYPDALHVFPCRLYEAGKSDFSHVMFEEFLDQRGIRQIPITLEERRGGNLNIVVTHVSQRAIGFHNVKRIHEALKTNGWQLDTVPADEMFVGNGGVHCMTCPLLVD